jgi:electron transport complex protein RnfD
MDYKALNLKASSSPHIRSNEDVRSIMLDVIIAMVPALIAAIWYFGFRALTVTVVSVIAAIFFEWLYCRIMHKEQPIGDLSAVVTGMLLAFTCPVSIPYWIIIIGDAFAIIIVKQLYGGLGKNFMNPALGARAFLFSWAGTMGTWVANGEHMTIGPSTDAAIDGITAATPLSFLHQGLTPDGTTLMQCFMGQTGGSLGEVSALMLIIGGIYLVWRKVITLHIPLAFILTVAVLTFIFPQGNDNFSWMVYNVFSGGVMLGAIFMATDYASSPVTHKGQIIFGIGCGLITVFIRYFGTYSEGVCFAIILMNCTVWLIDRHIKPVRFGYVKPEKSEQKGAAA